ncbi:MAG: ATP-binding protein, partial [Oscillospiraceae bacterium]|nr:ATP-binding protein [Oscillospiraceae bacterium]
LSIDLQPIPTDVALKEIQNQALAVETDITRWQNKQNQNNNFSAIPPMQLTEARANMREFLDDLTTRDQRMTLCVLTLVHIADSKEQLDADTETIQSIAGGKNCELSVLTYQQEDALNTVLPYGLRKIDTLRTLTTESAAALVPFSSQEIRHKNGIYYGVNATSRNLIICDRKQLLNGNGFILGVSGSGKSFAAKQEITSIALSTDDDIIIVDPEREYAPLAHALGAEVVQISAGSPNHINAMELSSGYGDVDGKTENPLILKTQFIMSLCEQLMKPDKVGAHEKSIIGRCVGNVYRDYIRDFTGAPPTLKEFREELLRQPEPQAQSIALALELFTDGALNVFAHESNVDMNNRIMVFDIFDLGSQLKTVGMLVMLDAILNRVIENHKRGKRTWIYIDEIYLFFANEYSTNFLEESWKRFRKKNAAATGITQNVTDCLRSPTAKNMLANSEFLLMLSQAPTDQQELVNLLHISQQQLGFITNAESGHGLIKVGGALVPFINNFPRNTELYRLMTTRPSDSL